MPNDVGVNGQSVVTKKSGGLVVTGPDVCKTPTPSGPVPIPYPNIAISDDLAKGSKNVKVNGVPACLKDSNLSKSVGDQAGTLGGVLSSKTGATAEPINYSFDVKIEGKNVVRNIDPFQSNNKNTPPAPILQAPVLVIAGMEKEPEEKLYECDWKDCKKKHTSKIEYDNDGCITRGSYTGTWKKPWGLTPGKMSANTTLAHYESETGKAGSLTEAKSLFGSKSYVVNNHHLIPISAMKKYEKLSHNAKLMGFDINNGRYGICLPYFIVDIYRHDLQSHKTSHPNYTHKVKLELRALQKECTSLCTLENQQKVINELQELADDLREYIITWSPPWLLRKSAVSDRVKSYKMAALPHP